VKPTRKAFVVMSQGIKFPITLQWLSSWFPFSGYGRRGSKRGSTWRKMVLCCAEDILVSWSLGNWADTAGLQGHSQHSRNRGIHASPPAFALVTQGVWLWQQKYWLDNRQFLLPADTKNELSLQISLNKHVSDWPNHVFQSLFWNQINNLELGQNF
jgi:hypothetical protein